MDTARQVLRWSLPGLLLLLNVVVFQAIWIGLMDQQNPWHVLKDLSVSGLIATVAGGLPVGFILYQQYVGAYTSATGWLPFVIYYRHDRGAEFIRSYLDTYSGRPGVITKLLPNDFSEADLRREVVQPPFGRFLMFLILDEHICIGDRKRPPIRCTDCRRTYATRWTRNSGIYYQVVMESARKPGFDWLGKEYTTGSDLFHGVGAARLAVAGAAVAVGSYCLALRPAFGMVDLRTYWTTPRSFLFWSDCPPWVVAIVALLLISAIATFEFSVLTRQRLEIRERFDQRLVLGATQASSDRFGTSD